tara:strand:+ start:135 stop:998 length:864 start_codon:yes stop_codon:yes gene_type:complete
MTTKNYLSIYAKSFNWSGFFLPKNIYINCSKLYDFCRTVDNIADQDASLDYKKNELIKFKNNFENKNYENVVIKNMWALMNEFNISKKIVDDLFDGVESDIKEEVKLKNEKELFIYSYRVAGTVGLMMAKIFNIQKRDTLRRAIYLGIAMQLTNIARDVVEDEKKNRVYLINYTKDTLINIKKIIYIADTFYNSSFIGIKDIPLNCRFSIVVARRVYRQIGNKILKKKNLDSYKKAEKIYVSNFGKIVQTLFSIKDFVVLFFIKKSNYEKEKEYDLISEHIELNERI